MSDTDLQITHLYKITVYTIIIQSNHILNETFLFAMILRNIWTNSPF